MVRKKYFINARIKEIISRYLFKSKLINWFENHRNNKDPLIVYYHRVHNNQNPLNSISSLSINARIFEEQIKFFRQRYKIVSLEEILDHYTGKIVLNPQYVAITFDDGFRDNYEIAYPILKKYKIPATIFVTAGYIDSNELLWWDKVFFQIDILQKNNILDKLCNLIDDNLYYTILNHCKLKNIKSMEAVIFELKRLGYRLIMEYLELIDNTLIEYGFEYKIPRQFLSWAEISEMIDNGISIGSHSMTHNMLLEMKQDQLEYEILGSKSTIEDKTGKHINFFSYPDGVLDQKSKEFVKDSGYLAAFQTRRKTYIPYNDHYAIGRFQVKENHSKNLNGTFSEEIFYLELAGVFEKLFFRKWRGKSPYQFPNAL